MSQKYGGTWGDSQANKGVVYYPDYCTTSPRNNAGSLFRRGFKKRRVVEPKKQRQKLRIKPADLKLSDPKPLNP